MIKLDAEEHRLSIDIKDDFGKALADMVIATLWFYAAHDEETKGQLMSISRMVKGTAPLADTDFINKESADA